MKTFGTVLPKIQCPNWAAECPKWSGLATGVAFMLAGIMAAPASGRPVEPVFVVWRGEVPPLPCNRIREVCNVMHSDGVEVFHPAPYDNTYLPGLDPAFFKLRDIGQFRDVDWLVFTPNCDSGDIACGAVLKDFRHGLFWGPSNHADIGDYGRVEGGGLSNVLYGERRSKNSIAVYARRPLQGYLDVGPQLSATSSSLVPSQIPQESSDNCEQDSGYSSNGPTIFIRKDTFAIRQYSESELDDTAVCAIGIACIWLLAFFALAFLIFGRPSRQEYRPGHRGQYYRDYE